MPVNVFGSTSGNNENNIYRSLFVQKPYLRTIYRESNIEDIDMKNQFRSKNLKDPISIRVAASKIFVDSLF